MPLPLRRGLSRLPKRLPVGSTFVIEGRAVAGNGDKDRQLQVFSRFVVLPGGRRIDLDADLAATRNRSRSRTPQALPSRPEPAAKKIIAGGGTTLRHYR
jgi:hypothetical protein